MTTMKTTVWWTLAAAAILTGIAHTRAEKIRVVPVFEEPLHVVKYRGEHFTIYTNWIESGIWTQYHEHRYDLLSIVVGDVLALNQIPDAAPQEQSAPSGTLVFFPYADFSEAAIHRVGVSGDHPFINIGVEFRDQIANGCATGTETWQAPGVQMIAENRRGYGYRLTISVGSEVVLPEMGRALFLVPLGASEFDLDGEPWISKPGDFRFYDGARSIALANRGSEASEVIIFIAC